LFITQFKAKGNAALQAKNYSEAIEYYTKAINLDGANVIYYSNRSAAYLSAGDAQNALEDAKACLGLDPNFSKGYSRKGAALHGLKLPIRLDSNDFLEMRHLVLAWKVSRKIRRNRLDLVPPTLVVAWGAYLDLK
jgi:tetratricopeptide (TPR) repeat protein